MIDIYDPGFFTLRNISQLVSDPTSTTRRHVTCSCLSFAGKACEIGTYKDFYTVTQYHMVSSSNQSRNSYLYNDYILK